MEEQKVPGVAAAVVSGGEVLWLEGFGFTDASKKTTVTPQTLFSVQSMSKKFTAAAVLMAVQEGLLDLDAPVTDCLPGFTVNSRFEGRPQDKMTLRLLLCHRAGFTHEAPVGSNYVPGGFEEHINSISRTWLRFPVGHRYSYSNLGIDLAERQADQNVTPFLSSLPRPSRLCSVLTQDRDAAIMRTRQKRRESMASRQSRKHVVSVPAEMKERRDGSE